MKKSDVKEKSSPVETDSLVSVEMTPEQRDRVVAILADEKKALSEVKEPVIFKMHLMFSHWISGQKYGPGRTVHVPEYLVGHLQHYEQLQKENEIKMNTSSNKMFQIFESGQTIPVRVK